MSVNYSSTADGSYRYDQDPLQNSQLEQPNSETASLEAAAGQSVMGGLSGSIAYMPPNNDKDDQYVDPGLIVEEHRLSQLASPHAGRNITINAEPVKEGSVLDDGKNAIQSFVKQVMENSNTTTSTTSTCTANANPAIMDAQVKLAHQDYKRRFQGRPANKDSKYYNITPEPCTGKYVVTKVRSWRAGYSRILSLHKSYFATLDPETHEITNLWFYSQVRHYMALPREEDCMLIDVVEDNQGSSTKLKFKCLPSNGSEALTAFAQHRYLYEITNTSVPRQQHPTFLQCQRLTRHDIRINSSLVCAPHGLIEFDPATGNPIRTYLYRCIKAASFLSDDVNGVVFYLGETSNSIKSVRWECKVWFVASVRVGGSGRSELITLLKNKFELLGLTLAISESVGSRNVIDMKLGRSAQSVVGERMGVFRVRKFSNRKKYSANNCEEDCTMRCLALTRNGYLLELDESGDASSTSNSVASCRSLDDVMNIVRHSSTIPHDESISPAHIGNSFTIEFKGGLCRTYASNDRDTVIVAILDATVYMCRNFNVTVTDVLSAPYRMQSSADASEGEISASAAAAAPILFQPELIEAQCLRQVHDISFVTHAYVQYQCHVDQNVSPAQILDECVAVIESCRGFNANVCIDSIGMLPNDKKLVEGSIRALWGISSTLLKYVVGLESSSEKDLSLAQSADIIHGALCAVFQTLYRLMMTEIGYTSTADNKEAIKTLSGVWRIEDSFALYWSLKCLSVLLLPRPFARERDREAEFVNKSILLGPRSVITGGLIGCMLGNTRRADIADNDDLISKVCSELVLMVVSNIIESILCSHHDTTSPEQFSKFVKELSSQ